MFELAVKFPETELGENRKQVLEGRFAENEAIKIAILWISGSKQFPGYTVLPLKGY